MWEDFYRNEFGLAVDLSQVAVPDNPGRFDRVIVVAQGVTIKMVLDACQKYFNVWTYVDDLDATVIKNDPRVSREWIVCNSGEGSR